MSVPKGEGSSHSKSPEGSGVVGEVAKAVTTGLLEGVGKEVPGSILGGFFESFFTGKGGHGGGGGKKGGHGHH